MKWAGIVLTIGLLVSGLFLWVTYFMPDKSAPPTYWDFSRNRSQTYYSNFAKSCDQLIDIFASNTTNIIKINGTNSQLPGPLLNFHATYIEVSEKRVWLVVDVNAGYGVTWQQDDIKPSVWNLTVRSEAEPIVVFAETNRGQISRPIN